MSGEFFNLCELPAADSGSGIRRRAAAAGQAMMTFFSFRPGSVVPRHEHPYDQLSVVVKGRAEFTVGDTVRVLGPGEGARMPGGTLHGVRILEEETEIWDAWAPLRREYLDAGTAPCGACEAGGEH